jgi:hypothetical protein
MKKSLFIIAIFFNSVASAQILQGWRFSPRWQIDMCSIDSLTFSDDGNTMYVNSKYGKAPVSIGDGINQIKIADKDSLQDFNILYPEVDLAQLLLKNNRIKLFNAALKFTGLSDSLLKYKDSNYDASLYEKYIYPSNVSKESSVPPEQHLYGFTAFVETDSMLAARYGITTLEQLYNKACQLYDPVYPEDATAPYHSMDSLTNRKNPLNRFIVYHLLNRTGYWDYLTCRGDISIEKAIANPCEWYETMSPHEMVKVEKLTVDNYVGAGKKGQLYLNRRYDDNYQIEGSMINKKIESNYGQQAVNGIYYYIDDILAFNTTTRDVVDNCRMRMDFSTLFPELMTNNIRGNGDYSGQNPDDEEIGLCGRNYYFPQGYLQNVKINGSFLYRRPHNYSNCYEGDEMDMFGNYDITFRLPSVPVEGDYQIRLGYTQEPTRGTVQVYFDDNLQGTPINMTLPLNNPSIGADYTKAWSLKTNEEKAAERKLLKDKGYYRGPASVYRLSGSTHYSFVNQPVTFRVVLCTVHITPGEYHTLRLKNASDDGSTELMLDYLEMVPKSVYGTTDEGSTENDL